MGARRCRHFRGELLDDVTPNFMRQESAEIMDQAVILAGPHRGTRGQVVEKDDAMATVRTSHMMVLKRIGLGILGKVLRE